MEILLFLKIVVTMMIKNNFYKHEATRDVFLEVLDISYEDEAGITLKVRMWNLGCVGSPWPMFIIDNYKIKISQISQYKKMSYEALTKARV